MVSLMTCPHGRQLLGGMNLKPPSAANLSAAQVQVRILDPLCAASAHPAHRMDGTDASVMLHGCKLMLLS